tara:strand:- start:15129 stop:15536 length:408 start_codon:yes stop_codon:yes gene_type:complete
MRKIYSKNQDQLLIASIIRLNEISDYRKDLSPDEEFLQVSARKFTELMKVEPHKHFQIERNTSRTQESWIIIKGKVKAEIFDVNDELIDEEILTDGDCIVLYRGGHSLEVLSKETVMYEVKNGPYFGKINDKTNL